MSPTLGSTQSIRSLCTLRTGEGDGKWKVRGQGKKKRRDKMKRAATGTGAKSVFVGAACCLYEHQYDRRAGLRRDCNDAWGTRDI